MRRALPLFFLLVVTAFAQTGKPPLTNNDVIEMMHAGVPQATILLAIMKTPSKFDVSPAGILALHAAGVPEEVLNQMIRAFSSPVQPTFGVVTGKFPVKDAAGKTVRFSAWIKTENVQRGFAGLWWRVDGPGEGNNRTTLAFDNSVSRMIDGKPDTGNGTMRGATGTTSWTRYEFELPVDNTVTNINFGMMLVGSGTAWVDGMKVELDGQPYSNPQLDIDLQTPTMRNYYMGCAGTAGCTDYKVGIDNTVVYTGHQSIKLQFIGDAAQK